MANNLVKGSGCGTREWREDFVLTDTDQSTALFSVAKATGNTVVGGTLNVTGLSTVAAVTASGTVTTNGALAAVGQATFTLRPIIPTSTPASNATGTAGMISWDADYLYVCTATNTWKRVALTGDY